ncbi:MAG: hypothetical protein K0U10_03285, partial [Gammaproteobacteria bacterium]|nr:hypothetical protein [Gammaproteobacteria bacterium]
MKPDSWAQSKGLDALDFSGEMFESEQGQMLKALIQKSMHDNPAERGSVKDACVALERLGTPPVRENTIRFKVEMLLEQCTAHRLDKPAIDLEMDKLQHDLEQKIQQATQGGTKEERIEKLSAIHDEMQGVLVNLEKSSEMVRHIEALAHKKVAAAYVRPSPKGRLMLKALGNIPPVERVLLLGAHEREHNIPVIKTLLDAVIPPFITAVKSR